MGFANGSTHPTFSRFQDQPARISPTLQMQFYGLVLRVCRASQVEGWRSSYALCDQQSEVVLSTGVGSFANLRGKNSNKDKGLQPDDRKVTSL